MGSQGRSPRQGLGAVAPVKSPFPGERGQGDRGSELEVCFKNRLFLQSDLYILFFQIIHNRGVFFDGKSSIVKSPLFIFSFTFNYSSVYSAVFEKIRLHL